MKRHTDDWGSPLGGDPEPTPKPDKAPRKDSLTGLVYYFKNSLPFESLDRIGAPVNGPALMKAFKKLQAEGFTTDDIRGMIDVFASRLVGRPLKKEILPWRAFVADLDSLASAHRSSNPKTTYGGWGTDSRLLEDE